MSLPISSYTFVTSGGQRRFVHSWQNENNDVIECNKCGSSCKETDAYGNHWIQPKTLDDNDNELKSANIEGMNPAAMQSHRLPTGPTSIPASSTNGLGRITTLMDHKEIIVGKNIESFMLCDTKAVSDTQQFLLDAGIKAIPDLLRAACAVSGPVRSLDIVLRFYVTINGEVFTLQTTALVINHYYDIRESVDMMFAMLLEKLKRYMASCSKDCSAQQKDFSIKRINIKVQRFCERNPTLPLQFARKQAPTAAMTTGSGNKHQDLALINSWFRKHLLTSQPLNGKDLPFPCNLYSIQQCSNSLELYAVPYHLNFKANNLLSCRSFAIICDISGYFIGLQEISNIRRFLHHSSEDRIVSCSSCLENFTEPSKLTLHKMLNCGRGFELVKMDPDFIEIYEQCWLLEKCDNWTLFGIVE
ncbi:protein terminus-like [Stomoxys calcitrans]|uniref:C2H2-type domain-containing protein n=1 Tax=Stomoxys calcitrans TaxID=35570 RepID=A0A1I8Q2U0_STOCA|nr:protein terminus-like [Stomoxys calcitrans]